MLRSSKKRSANAARLRVDRRKAESFRDTRRVNSDAHFAPRKRAANTYSGASHDDPLWLCEQPGGHGPTGEVVMRYLLGFLCVCALGVLPVVGCGETQRECQSAEDCNDGNECTEDACNVASGTCSNTSVDDGRVCSFDGVSGVCVSGACGENLCEGVVCEDDDNECTGDVCNFADGTCNVPDGTSCSGGACLDAAPALP